MPLPPNRADALRDAPVIDIIDILLKQFKTLLARHDIDFTTSQQKTLVAAIAREATDFPQYAALCAALRDLVRESVDVLKQWDFTFAQSLRATMDSIPGWQTTADFLELANEKGNAELRISAGSTLLVLLGDRDYVSYLFDVLDDDNGAGDVDAALAQRALCFLTKVDHRAPDWLAQVRARLRAQLT